MTDEKADLILLAPDQDMEFTFEALISRNIDLGFRKIAYDIFRHPQRDAGCRALCVEFLRSFINQYRYAIVAFDKHGCGRNGLSAAIVEKEVEENLARNGWQDRAKVIVLDPELENWMWNSSPQLPAIIGWKNPKLSLKDWLIENGHLAPGDEKPPEPKAAFEKTLRETTKRRSASIYRAIAETAAVNSCADSSFLKFRNAVREWFPPGPAEP